ncbi:MAG TPA: methyltransferase, partial [Caldilineae bacterium]|nr:methyltransferase [Caldilineae bacterium]
MSRTAKERRNRRGSRRRNRNEIPLLSVPFRQLRNRLAPLEVISAEQVEQIHEASMQILEDVGLRWLDEEALDLWEKAGAKIDRSQKHAWLDRGLVMELVAKAPASFTWRARNPAHDIIIGGDSINFFGHSGMVYVSDLDAGRRTGTFQDFEKLLKLQQMSNVL